MPNDAASRPPGIPTTLAEAIPPPRTRADSPRSHRLLNVAVVASWLYAAHYTIWVTRDYPVASRSEQDFLFLPLYLFAGFGAMAGAWQERLTDREVLGWRMIGWGWILSFVSAVFWLLRDLLPGGVWLNEPASLLYNAYYPLVAGGFILLSSIPTRPLSRVRLAFDVSIVVAACATISWYFTHDAEGASSPLQELMGIGQLTAYGELVIILAASVALYRPGPLGGRVALQVLSLAAFGASVADLILVRSASPGYEPLRALGNSILAIGAATFATAGMLRARIARASPAPLGEVLPIVAIATIGALLIVEMTGRAIGEANSIAGLAIGLMVLTLLVLARLTIAQYEARLEGAARIAQQARFVHLVQRSSEAVLVVGREGVATYASPAGERVLGIATARLTSAPIDSLFPEADHEPLRAAVASPTDGASVRWAHAAGGMRRELETIVTDLRTDPAMRGIVLTTRDVTDRVRLEMQLRQSQKLDALGLLAGGIAHDFNNILAAVRANADYLLYTQPEHTEFELEEIRKATDRGAALCTQLLAFSRAEPQRPETLDIAEVIDGIVPMLRRVVPRTIVLDVRAPSEALYVRGDRVQLEIAILNLVVNARDAMPDGGTLSITTGLRQVVGDDGWALEGVPVARYVVLTVHDTGVGMDEATRLRVLEPFFTTKPVGQGTGLGLSTVYGVVSSIGGHLRLASDVGLGTSVTLFFPVATRTVDPGTPPSANTAIPEQRGRVLVVDDEDAVRSGIVRYLREHGYSVLLAADGQEGLEILDDSQWEIDAVVSDVTMPRMDGIALAARILAARPELPVILVSGNGALRDTPSAEALPGPVDWLLKPFGLDELQRLLAKRLAATVARD